MISNIEYFSNILPLLIKCGFIMGISMYSIAFIFHFGIDLLLSVFKIITK